jgi:predicted nucleic-acid-binding Zn-ribbon protein
MKINKDCIDADESIKLDDKYIKIIPDVKINNNYITSVCQNDIYTPFYKNPAFIKNIETIINCKNGGIRKKRKSDRIKHSSKHR